MSAARMAREASQAMRWASQIALSAIVAHEEGEADTAKDMEAEAETYVRTAEYAALAAILGKDATPKGNS